MGPARPGFQLGCQGKEGGSSYNPQAGRAGRPPGAGSTALRLALGSSDASAPLRLPPPPPRSSAAAAASPGRPPPATCCPGREEREPPPQTFVSGRRLLPAPSADGPGEGGDGDGGRKDGARSRPRPLKTQRPARGSAAPLPPPLSQQSGPGAPGGDGAGAARRDPPRAALPGCPSDRQGRRSAFCTFAAPPTPCNSQGLTESHRV